jgi:Polyketide cyclase / dehydrase and lipid transport
MRPRHAITSTEAVAAAGVKATYDAVGAIDPTRYYRRYGPLPAVREVRDQTGEWDEVGRSRVLLLSDGGYVREYITDAESPDFFAYDSEDFQKLFGRLVYGSRAEWTFSPVPGGTRIRWTYAFHARPGMGASVRAIVRLFWAPYMRKVLKSIVGELERAA